MINIVFVALLILYPLLVWVALQQASPRMVAAVMVVALVALAGGALLRAHELLPLLLRRFGVLVVFALVAAAYDDPLALKLLPAFSHLWLLVTFAATLVHGPTVAEQFARSVHEDFPDFLRPYTRGVTVVWCVFFAMNAAIYTWLAIAAPTATWALYTGFGFYVLAFALFAGEYVFHKVHFRYYEDGWTDRIWRRVLPPERSERGRRTLAWQSSRQGGMQSGPAGSTAAARVGAPR